MVRRFRSATALVALTTLFAFAAEGAAALVFCDPPVASASGADDGAHAGHGSSAPVSDESGAGHENHCPLGMTGNGSCAVASLPAGVPDVQGAPVTSDRERTAPVVSNASGLIHPLFHPPRA